MPRSEQQKLKLLFLKQILEQESDENHPLSAQTLIDRLAENGVVAERKSIYNDIQCLQDFGMDIICRRGQGGGFFLASREFELSELKLLVDAVQSSKFLTVKKSMQLIEKLATLSNRYEARSLDRQVVVSGRVKNMNESIFYNVDRLHDAISNNSQIRFRYFDWDLQGERAYRPGPYYASPYALCWDNENYYLIAHTEKHGLTHYRVDKMSDIVQTGQPRQLRPNGKKPDLSRYGSSVFGMYAGEPETVKLRFHRSLTGVVLDRFGRDVLLIPDGDEHFVVTAEIAVSPNFFGWVAGFSDRAEILFPEHVREEFKGLCRLCASQYEESSP